MMSAEALGMGGNLPSSRQVVETTHAELPVCASGLYPRFRRRSVQQWRGFVFSSEQQEMGLERQAEV